MLFACTEEFKAAFEKYAQTNKMSASELVRQCVAKEIGYDFSKEPNTDKRRKYNSEEERKEVLAQRRKEQQNVAKLLAAFHDKEQRIFDVSVLEEYLEKKGVSDG